MGLPALFENMDKSAIDLRVPAPTTLIRDVAGIAHARENQSMADIVDDIFHFCESHVIEPMVPGMKRKR